MKITSVDVWKVVVPTRPGTVHSPAFGPAGWDQVPKFIIRLNTDEGLPGIGETHRGVPRLAVDSCAERMVGLDPLRLSLQYLPLDPPRPDVPYPGRDWEIGGGTGVSNPAHDAFEMALFDLVGKTLGVPAHFLLGGAFRTRVKADFWIGQQTPEDAARNVRLGKARGFGGVKMKCAIDDPWIERIAAIVEMPASRVRLCDERNVRIA